MLSSDLESAEDTAASGATDAEEEEQEEQLEEVVEERSAADSDVPEEVRVHISVKSKLKKMLNTF